MVYRVPLSMTEWPRTPVLKVYKGEYLPNGAFNPLPSLVLYRVFGVSGSNDVICRSIKSNMAANVHLGYTKMAITSRLVCRSTWCLVQDWGFRLSLDFYHRGHHTRTAVAHNPCVSWVFLLLLSYLSFISMCGRLKRWQIRHYAVQ